VFVLGQVAFKARVVGVVGRQRIVAAVVLLATIPALRSVDAWVGVTISAAVMWLLIGYELWHHREARAEARRWDSSH
jgi:hypothetical protein